MAARPRLPLAVALAATIAAASASAHPSRGIVVAADGTVYFSDLVKIRAIYPDGKTRVLRVNADGHTHSLAIAADGAVWGDQSAYDPTDGRYREAIWRMRPEGSLTYRYGPRKDVGRGIGLLRDARGCTWHADRPAKAAGMLVHRKCPGRPTERMFGDAGADRAFRPVLVNDVAGTALAADGSFIFRDGDTIRRVAPDGSVRSIARGLARENFGIALGPAGSVLVAEHSARRVVSVSPGRAPKEATRSAAPWAPTGVAWHRGDLYVLEARDHRRGERDRMRVRRVGPQGKAVVIATVVVTPR